MEYLHNAATGLLLLLRSIVIGTFALLTLLQPATAPPYQTASTTSRPTQITTQSTAPTQISPTTTTVETIGTSTSSTDSLPKASAYYGQWFTVDTLPSYCQGNNPAVPNYPTVPAYGTLTVQSDGIYLDGLKLDVDEASFEVFCEQSGARNFWRDAQHVYFDGIPFSGNVAADLTTFTPLQSANAYESYAKDKYHAFAATGEPGALAIIPEADVNSFVSDPHLYPFAKDDRYVYLLNKIVPGADPTTFSVIGTAHARDRTHVYWYGSGGGPIIAEPISGADVSSFEEPPMWDNYGRDLEHVYYDSEMCPQIDLTSFVVVNTSTSSDAYDRNNHYVGCDVAERG